MQKVAWYGVGNGTFDDPILLINSSSFNDGDSFGIEILTTHPLKKTDVTYVKFSTFQPGQIFRLGVIFSNISPLNPISVNRVGEKTAFNGNNNYGIVDGPYNIVVRDGNRYVLKQHIYTKNDIFTPEEINEEIVRRIDEYLAGNPLTPDITTGGGGNSYEPDGVTIVLNEDDKLKVSENLEIDGGFL